MRRIAAICCFLVLFPLLAGAGHPRQRLHQIKQGLSESDVRAEIEFGREVAARIAGRFPIVEDESLTRYVNLVTRSLAMYSNRPELEFTAGVLDTDMINAFSAPGGYIFITRGAIGAMEDEAELAAVIAHEIIHVTRKHIVRELNIHGSDTSPASGFARLIGGVADPARIAFSKAVNSAMKIIFERGYRKQDEIESDTMGVVLTAMAGYDPVAMVRYLERIAKMEGDEIASYRRLYPSFEERIGHVRETIEREGLGEGIFKTGRKRFNEYKKD